MARRISVHPRRGEIEEKKKAPYLKKDNIILRVAAYLVTKKEKGATIHNIISDKGVIGLSKQDQSRFTEKIMKTMENDGWVKKVTYSPRVSVYFITASGVDAVSEAHKLRINNNLLSTLEAFRDIVPT